MDVQTVCYCILILAAAFALLCLGLLFLRASGAVKEATVLMTITETTLEKVNHILDDINNKMAMLDAPVELVSGFFSRGALKTGLFSGLATLLALFRRKNKRTGE